MEVINFSPLSKSLKIHLMTLEAHYLTHERFLKQQTFARVELMCFFFPYALLYNKTKCQVIISICRGSCSIQSPSCCSTRVNFDTGIISDLHLYFQDVGIISDLHRNNVTTAAVFELKLLH